MVTVLKKAFVLCFILLLNSLSLTYSQAVKVISTADELKSFYNISSLPAYLPQTLCGQISTYDTTGGNNDGFNGTYSFIRRNKDSSLVIFDKEGPGVINRFWTPTPTADTLEFYIDDTLRPVLSICYLDLFSGKIFPFIQPLCGNQLGGYYCYYPILFQKCCRVICRGKQMQFHQIQYRLFTSQTKIISFSQQPDKKVKDALESIKALWNKAGHSASDFSWDKASIRTIKKIIQLTPGEAGNICTINSGGRIAGIELTPSDAFEGLLKNIDIRVFWNHETVPAIDCPVADFFGFAFGKPSMQSLLLGVINGKCYCYFPMPFDKSARIELVYRNYAGAALRAVQITAAISYTTTPQNMQTEGKFYARWQQTKPASGEPLVFLSIKGKGHYVGTVLQAQGLQTGMTTFFEGDDSTVIDGKVRLHGTGSEDYFNGGWYALQDRWDAPLSLPMHGALDYSLLFSRTGGYRFYLNDKLSFSEAFYHSIEHGPEHNDIPVLYTSVCFYYSNAASVYVTNPSDIDTRVYIPDTLTIYPQFTKVQLGSNMSVQTTWDSASIGQSFDIRASNESGLVVSPRDIPEGRYKIFIDYVTQPNGCSFSVWQRQSQLSDWRETKSDVNVFLRDQFVGNIYITKLNNTITVRFHTDELHRHFLWSKLILVKSI